VQARWAFRGACFNPDPYYRSFRSVAYPAFFQGYSLLKLSDNPPILYPGEAVLTASRHRWWVAHTKARFEKSFAWDLQAKSIAYFLPLIERLNVSGGKRRTSMVPLFPSYVFFRGDEMARYTALTTGRLCRVIEISDQQGLTAELSSVNRALQGKAVLTPHPTRVVGSRCRVTAGPFEGLEGVVVRVDDMTRLVLQVGILGQGAAMEIDADLVEPLEALQRMSRPPGMRLRRLPSSHRAVQ
jgi:transcription antitermination factor NusG